ncbi:MAG: GNAT family N-acetyltransferase [Eisenbergiella sp.]
MPGRRSGLTAKRPGGCPLYGDPKYPYTKEDALADIRSFLRKKTNPCHTYHTADGRPRHRLLLSAVRGQKSVELGYWIGKQYWGQGISTYAAKQLCDFAFRTLDINRICASALEVNVGSWRVMEKLGMRREGTFIKAIYQNGEFFNDLYYAVLREEYSME